MELPITVFMLILVLVAVAFAFFVMPTFAPMTLMIATGITLFVAVYMHWSRFGVDQYERATWTNRIKEYGGYITIAVALLGAYGFYAMNNVSGGSAMPAIVAPTSGGGFGIIAKTVRSRIGELIKKGRISTD
jgi:uncharacterized membrane protein